jgi:hypothetical protein
MKLRSTTAGNTEVSRNVGTEMWPKVWQCYKEMLDGDLLVEFSFSNCLASNLHLEEAILKTW